MAYHSFHCSRIGASHLRGGLPCQDASAGEVRGEYCAAVVADGHGSRRHFRSERGSALACSVSLEQIFSFLEENGEAGPDDMEERLNALKRTICSRWMAAVLEDFAARPWTGEELAEEREILTAEQFASLEDGTDAPYAYGTTLCAAFAWNGGWAAIQLGDGCFVHVSRDGYYRWLMPASLVNNGNRTASLCMHDPMLDFRHCWGTDDPASLLVFTDGIEKTLPPQGREVVSLLHWAWRNAQTGSPENLSGTLDAFTRRSPLGDDVSIAGLFDPAAEDAEPVSSTEQRRRELEKLQARIAEIESTIAFNGEQLDRARRNEKDLPSGAAEQLEEILQRKRSAADALRQQAESLYTELGEAPPEPAPSRIESSAPEKDEENKQKAEPAQTESNEPELVRPEQVFDANDPSDVLKRGIRELQRRFKGE